MKVSLNHWEKEYLGSYLSDYDYSSEKTKLEEQKKQKEKDIKWETNDGKKLRKYKNEERILANTLKELEYSKDWRTRRVDDKSGKNKSIDKSESRFLRFMVDKIDSLNDIGETIKDMLCYQKKTIRTSDFLKIERILKEVVPKHNVELYINDFVLFVLYAKKILYQRNGRLVSKKQRMDIEEFFSKMAYSGKTNETKVGNVKEGKAVEKKKDIEIDIVKITIDYKETKCLTKEKEDVNSKLVIDSPALMKMMLYEFATRYCTFIEKKEFDEWKHHLCRIVDDNKRREVVIEDNEKKLNSGRKQDYYKEALKNLIQAYEYFIDGEKLLERGSKREKAYFFGKLLAVIGHNEALEEDKIDEKTYYYDIYRSYLK